LIVRVFYYTRTLPSNSGVNSQCLSIEQIKKEAKELSKKTGLRHQEAINQVAINYGYQSYSHLRKDLLNNNIFYFGLDEKEHLDFDDDFFDSNVIKSANNKVSNRLYQEYLDGKTKLIKHPIMNLKDFLKENPIKDMGSMKEQREFNDKYNKYLSEISSKYKIKLLSFNQLYSELIDTGESEEYGDWQSIEFLEISFSNKKSPQEALNSLISILTYVPDYLFQNLESITLNNNLNHPFMRWHKCKLEIKP
jgi:hypothetical protein